MEIRSQFFIIDGDIFIWLLFFNKKLSFDIFVYSVAKKLCLYITELGSKIFVNFSQYT